MIPLPIDLTYQHGSYTIGRGDVQARCDDADEVCDMLVFLGMTERLAERAMQLVREQPGEELNFSWREKETQ